MTSARLLRSAAAFAVIAALAPWARAGVAAQGIPVRLGGELSSLPGVPVDVPLIADMTARPADKIGAFAVRFTWNPAVLQLDAVTPGSFGAVTPALDSAAQGILRIAGANPAGAGGQVTLSTLRFTPLIVDTTTVQFTLGQLYAAGTFTNLLPFVSATGGAYCSAVGRYGDLNANGAANGFDALVVLNAAVGLPAGPYNLVLGDVDADGATGTRDALIILSNAVGLDVSAFRVLHLAPGGCTPAGLSTLAVAPNAVTDVLPGQTVRFEARATGAGGLTTIVNATWSTSNAAVIQITPAGVATAQAAGTATIRAVRDGVDSVAVNVTVVAARSRHYVDAAALAVSNQLGTLALPFGRINDAAAIAAAGDTIQVRPGRYDESVQLLTAVLLVGDTLPNGARPEIAGVDTLGVAVSMTGTGPRTVRDMAVTAGMVGFAVRGPDAVRLEGVHTRNVGWGVRVDTALRRLDVRRSRLGGDAAAYGNGVSADLVRVDSLFVDSSVIGDFTNDGIRVWNWDHIDVRRSTFHDLGSTALYLGDYVADTTAESGNDVVLEFNRFDRVDDVVLYVQGFRDALLRRNTALGNEDDLYYFLYGRTARITGDSVDGLDGTWLDVYRLDSIYVDSLRARVLDSYGYVYDTRFLSVTNSMFTDASDEVIEMYYGGGPPYVQGGRAIVDNVTIVGDPACWLCASGFYLDNVRTTVNRLSVFNAYAGVELGGDSSLTVTNSLFEDVEYGIQYYGYYGIAGSAVTVTNSTFRRVQDWALELYDGAITVDSNTFDGGYGVLDGGAWQPMTVTRNRINDFESGITLYAYDSTGTHTVADNVLLNIRDDEAVYAEGDSYQNQYFRWNVLRNTIGCVTQYGDGIWVDAADAKVEDNVISGCRRAITVGTSYDTLQTRDTVQRNTITLPQMAEYGIRLRNNSLARIAHNVITGDSTVLYQYVDGIRLEHEYFPCVYYYPTYRCDIVALVDSNTISGFRGNGIAVLGADSVTVAANTITDIAGGGGYNAGVYVSGPVQFYGRITRNTIRRAEHGIQLTQNDTAGLLVDSNLVRHNGAGLRIYGATVTAAYNRFADNTGDGLRLESGTLTATQNNIHGNGYGLRNFGPLLAATANWWGSASGPSCDTVCGSGDSVSANVDFSGFLGAESGTTPPLSVPPIARAPRRAPLGAAAVTAPASAARFEGRPSRVVALRGDSTTTPALREAAVQRLRAEQRAARERREAEAAAARLRRHEALRAERERARQAGGAR